MKCFDILCDHATVILELACLHTFLATNRGNQYTRTVGKKRFYIGDPDVVFEIFFKAEICFAPFLAANVSCKILSNPLIECVSRVPGEILYRQPMSAQRNLTFVKS